VLASACPNCSGVCYASLLCVCFLLWSCRPAVASFLGWVVTVTCPFSTKCSATVAYRVLVCSMQLCMHAAAVQAVLVGLLMTQCHLLLEFSMPNATLVVCNLPKQQSGYVVLPTLCCTIVLHSGHLPPVCPSRVAAVFFLYGASLCVCPLPTQCGGFCMLCMVAHCPIDTRLSVGRTCQVGACVFVSCTLQYAGHAVVSFAGFMLCLSVCTCLLSGLVQKWFGCMLA
jgi:hypothetical protein